MKRIAIAVDSFKGSLSSREVAEAFEEGFRTYLPDCEILKISIAKRTRLLQISNFAFAASKRTAKT